MKLNSADADLKDWVAFFPLVDLGKDEPHTLCPLFNRNEVEQILPLCRVIGLVNMYEIRPREYLLNRFVKQKNLALPPMYRLLDKNLNKKLTGNGIGDEKFKYYLSCSQILFDEQNDDYDSEWIMEESECEEDQINDDDDDDPELDD
jgi:hypothetical protein